MRKLLLAPALAGAVVLSACATAGTGSVTIQDVQNAAVAACSFLPTADSVAALLNANGAIMTAAAIAKLICAAITPAHAGRMKAAPGPITVTVTVGGRPIAVTGSFVAASHRSRAH